MKRVLTFDGAVDLRLTLKALQHGRGDPTTRVDIAEAWRATRTPEGPATQHLRLVAGRVEVEAWGAGATWLLERAPDLLGMHDDPRSFAPEHPRLREMHRRHPGFRVGRSHAVVETIVPTILEQKVTGAGARRSYRALIRAFGEPAPGPFGLRLQPDPKVLASLPYQDFHPFGVERRRAATLKVACSYAARLEETNTMDLDAARKRMMALPGVGVWTTALVAGIAWGDTDAVELNDFHVPHQVCWFLAGEPRGTDERMLELLEPYAGQRWRALRLIEASGVGAPRFGPRLEITDYAKI
ncbi:MAG TPA: DNA-3-methyladenine glycosylase 2 family protein [Actinomycetota bacterium]|nr:DNA-3-methyladenine glycosylase 2 family protein [Actinomycetota bacterium]